MGIHVSMMISWLQLLLFILNFYNTYMKFCILYQTIEILLQIQMLCLSILRVLKESSCGQLCCVGLTGKFSGLIVTLWLCATMKFDTNLFSYQFLSSRITKYAQPSLRSIRQHWILWPFRMTLAYQPFSQRYSTLIYRLSFLLLAHWEKWMFLTAHPILYWSK